MFALAGLQSAKGRIVSNGLQPDPTGGRSPRGNPRPHEGRGLHKLIYREPIKGRFARRSKNRRHFDWFLSRFFNHRP